MEANGLEFMVLFHNLVWKTVTITKTGMMKSQQIANQTRPFRIRHITPSCLLQMMVVKLQAGGTKRGILWTGTMLKKSVREFQQLASWNVKLPASIVGVRNTRKYGVQEIQQ